MSPRPALLRGVRPLGGPPPDVLLRDGGLAEMGAGIDAAGAQVLDADGLVALPGLVDLHTHLREPGREDAETVETGTRAAALGGFTAVHAMANTEPVADTAGVVEQVANGVSVRMAVLYLLLSGAPEVPTHERLAEPALQGASA